MDQQNGLFGFLENHVMGPMGKLAQFKVVRAITAAGMAAVPFTIVGSMFLVFSILPQAFSFWPTRQQVWQLYHLLLLGQCSWYLVFCHKLSHSGQL